MKKETFYAPFACSFTDLLHGAPVHEGRDGMVIAIRDAYQAHEAYEKLQNVPGAQLSAYGCGPRLNQHVYLPSCAGIATLTLPQGLVEGDKQAIALQEHPEYISEVKIKVSGDIAHGPIDWAQLTMGVGVDYSGLQKQVSVRFDDLARIVDKIAAIPDAARQQVDLYDEYARDSLREMYNSNGCIHSRVRLASNPTPEQTAMHFALEYFQTYMKACEINLPLGFMLHNAHDLPGTFKEQFESAYSHNADYRSIAAAVTCEMLKNMAQGTQDIDTKAILICLANEADRDFNAYSNGTIKQTQDIDAPEHEEEEIE